MPTVEEVIDAAYIQARSLSLGEMSFIVQNWQNILSASVTKVLIVLCATVDEDAKSNTPLSHSPMTIFVNHAHAMTYLWNVINHHLNLIHYYPKPDPMTAPSLNAQPPILDEYHKLDSLRIVGGLSKIVAACFDHRARMATVNIVYQGAGLDYRWVELFEQSTLPMERLQTLGFVLAPSTSISFKKSRTKMLMKALHDATCKMYGALCQGLEACGLPAHVQRGTPAYYSHLTRVAEARMLSEKHFNWCDPEDEKAWQSEAPDVGFKATQKLFLGASNVDSANKRAGLGHDA